MAEGAVGTVIVVVEGAEPFDAFDNAFEGAERSV